MPHPLLLLLIGLLAVGSAGQEIRSSAGVASGPAQCVQTSLATSVKFGFLTPSTVNVTVFHCSNGGSVFVEAYTNALGVLSLGQKLPAIIYADGEYNVVVFPFAFQGYQNQWWSEQQQQNFAIVYSTPAGNVTQTIALQPDWPQPNTASISTVNIINTYSCISCNTVPQIFLQPTAALLNPSLIASNASGLPLQSLQLTVSNGFNLSLYRPTMTFLGFAITNTSTPSSQLILDPKRGDLPFWITVNDNKGTDPLTSTSINIVFTPLVAQEGLFVVFGFQLQDTYDFFEPSYIAVSIVPTVPTFGTSIAHWFWIFPFALFMTIFTVAYYQIKSGCEKRASPLSANGSAEEDDHNQQFLNDQADSSS